jgi:nitrogen regulatory protein PII
MTKSTGKNSSLAIKAIQGELLPDEQTYQAKLRSAIYDGVKEADVSEIIKGIVEKAKSGDPGAQKMFFDYVLGAKTAPTTINVNNHFANAEQALNMRGRTS